MSDWPAPETREVPWTQAYRGGPREEGMLRSNTVSLPPRMAALTLSQAQYDLDREADRLGDRLDHEVTAHAS